MNDSISLSLRAIAQRSIKGTKPFELALILTAMLTGLGCAHAPNYSRVPENLPIAADVNSEPLRQAHALQQSLEGPALRGPYRMGKNDVLNIKIYKSGDLTPTTDITQHIGDDGKISIPILGDMLVLGETEDKVAQTIKDKLAETLPGAQVTAFIQEVHANEIGVLGSVRTPGKYSSQMPMRFADAIQKAGGLSAESIRKAVVTRVDDSGKTSAIDIDVQGAIHLDPAWNILMVSGDLIDVLSEGTVHVTGDGINKAGTYPLADKNLLQLIDDAGGLKWEADRKIFVVRKTDPHQRKVFVADYASLMEVKTTDIDLRNGDRIVVDNSTYRVVLSSIGTALKNTFRFVISAGGNIDLFNSGNRNGGRTTSVD